MATPDPKAQTNHLWEVLKHGTPTTGTILSIKGDPKQLEEAKRLLESHEKLRGIEVAKW